MTTARGPVTLTELTAGLIWPTIFRAAPVALHPSRLAVGFVMVALIMGIGSLHDALTAPVVAGGGTGVFGEFIATIVDVVNSLARGVVTLDPGLIAFALFDRPAAAWALLAERPWSSLALLLGQTVHDFDVEGQTLDLVNVPYVRPGIPSELLNRRPDLVQAEASVRSLSVSTLPTKTKVKSPASANRSR